MKEIPLSQGKVALVDDEDYTQLIKYKWHAIKQTNTFNAVTHIKVSVGKRTIKAMHAMIMNTPKGMDTDHIDGDGLNNQRNNLRICTHQENVRNGRKRVNNKSGFRGVHWSKKAQKWVAQISVNYKKKNLGYFVDKKEAARAYIEAAKKYHKKFIRKEILSSID